MHFIGLVNVVDLKAGGLGNLGNEQLEWLEADVKSRSASTPIVVFAHIPLWTVYPEWGWGTQDGAQALSYLKRFGSVTVLNGHIHQVMQKVEGNVTFHTARSTAFPQPAPGAAPSPGPMKVEDDKLRTMLGTASITFKQNEKQLAIIDTAAEELKGQDHAAKCNQRGAHRRRGRVGVGWRRDVRQGASPGAAAAAAAVGIDNFTFNPQTVTVKAGTTVTWTNRDDIPHGLAADQQRLQAIAGARYRRQLFVHLHHAGHLPILLLHSSAHDRHDRGRSGNRQQHDALMLDRLQHQASTAPWTAGRAIMTGTDKITGTGNVDGDKTRRFRDAALPHLDDVFTLARYLMRNAADAEDAVQECYLRALRHFDSYRGPAMKPWLLAILKNVCVAEFARRSRQPVPAGSAEEDTQQEEVPMWQEPQASPEAELLRRFDDATIRRLVGALPQPFRETIVLREINDLSYREIADIVGAPVGTVMSRLARARAMLRTAWNAEDGS